jgi:hypothetical protein
MTSTEEDPPYLYKGYYLPKDVEKVIIDPSVTTIDNYAFYGCTSLASIEIPQGVKRIGEYAFHGCTSLASIEIPQSVTTICYHAFEGCTSLASIEIPQSVTTIGSVAFSGCTSLTSIEIPQSVTTVGLSAAFSGCTSLASIGIPQSVTTIAKNAFNGCTSLASIEIPQSVTKIGYQAFEGCTSLASIEIPQSVTKIAKNTFSGCTSLASIEIPQSVTKIENQAFYGCLLLAKGAAAGANTKAVEEWLKTRFDDLPLHQVCYKSDVTREKITTCLERYPDSVKLLDSLDLSALHVLLMNGKVTLEMVDVLLKAHPSALKDVGPLGMYLLHLACNNPRSPPELLKALGNTHIKDGRLVLMAGDENNHLPCALAIRNDRSNEIILHLFECYPIKAINLRTNQERGKLKSICDQYMQKLLNLSEGFMFDPLQQHGWVSFVNEISDSAKICAELIGKRPIEIVRRLAYYKDLQGRSAIESATKEIRAAMEKRLLLFGRFELARGPPLHKSSTSIVIKAIDRGA